MIRGVRGATTVEENNANDIIQATEKLLLEMIHSNKIEPTDVASVMISVTDDLTASFPAKALRNIGGWMYVPVMCMQEINVPNALSHCIRVMMTINTSLEQEEVNHIYLEKATALRPDLIDRQ
ncbi:chorismate mutase [Cytobacillus sp. Hm23]|uniref:chorismate mutase n=1 Tax=Cytobacillus sp. IB215665 TaxID=3097357 RepID=UPI002A0E54CC|nr:chorismate mutase [Cytobacillus sp. IB215665]MDX8364856.1 chorismate mutase [Cytobacillus sp. IB215665]